MSLMRRLIRRFVAFRAPKDPAERELYYLERKMKLAVKWMDRCTKRLDATTDYSDQEYYQYHLIKLQGKYTRQIQRAYEIRYKLAQGEWRQYER